MNKRELIAQNIHSFEYSTVNAEIKGKVESILKPKSRTIKADCINKLILEENSYRTKIICPGVICRLEHAE